MWRVHPEIFSASNNAKMGLLRGYCDADGSPVFNKSRKQPLIKIESVNHKGLLEINRLFQELSYNTHVWRESKTRETGGLYLTRLEDIQRFWQEVGFNIVRKQSRLLEIISLEKS